MRYHDLRRAQLPQIYRGGLFRTFSVAIRAGWRRERAGRRRRRTLAEVRPGTAVQDVRLLAAIVDDALGPMRVAVWLMSGFGVLALTLAAVGIYGVFSYFVARAHARDRRAPDARRDAVRGAHASSFGRGAGAHRGRAGGRLWSAPLAVSGAATGLLYEVRHARSRHRRAGAALCVASVAVAAAGCRRTAPPASIRRRAQAGVKSARRRRPGGVSLLGRG